MDQLLPLLAGLALLALGGEFLVRGAVRVAARLGVSPLLVGLTLVGFGTSTPELVTSVQASLSGSPGIAVGNVVGSNIANVLVILGIAALVAPVAVTSRALSRDGVVGVAASVALLGVGLFWALDRAVGAAFLLALAGYLWFAWRQESAAEAATNHGAAWDRAEARPHHARPAPPAGLAVPLLTAFAGLVAVVVGGRLLVGAAVELARLWQVSEAVIGLTVVAVGTSLPELVTSLVAAARRQGEVALGNVLGSNIYNVFGIAGATALIAPTAIPPEMVRFDLWAMLAVSLLLLAVARTGWRVGRREGVLLLAIYAAYVWWLWPA